MANIKNSNSKLGKQRSVECPTCHAKAGDYCVSVGLKGRLGGKMMTTSCHSQRIIDAGGTPRYQQLKGSKLVTPKGSWKPKPAKPKVDRSAAGKRAWKTRLARQRKREKIDDGFANPPALEVQSLGDSSVLELVSAALNILSAERVHELTLHSHIANIHATSAAGVITLTINK